MNEILENLEISENLDTAVVEVSNVEAKIPRPIGRPRKFQTRDLRTMSFQLPAELHLRLKTYCSLRKREMSEVLRERVEEFLGLNPNTEDQLAFEKLQGWFVEYKQTPGATLGEVLEKLREIQVSETTKLEEKKL